jgi:DNA (cytosine-5)-methyltransferase 1
MATKITVDEVEEMVYHGPDGSAFILKNGKNITIADDSDKELLESLARRADLEWLQQEEWPSLEQPDGTMRGVDLFSGCGGISAGLWEACRNIGINLEMVMACDLFPAAKESYVENFAPTYFLDEPIENRVNGQIGDELTDEEEELKAMLGNVDIVVGGPPCQGNSNLNNHTRGTDPRNELYMRMIRFVEVFKPKYVLIENVRGVVNAKQKVVPRANAILKDWGYVVDHGVVKGQHVGIPQTRARHFTVAVKSADVDIDFKAISAPTVSEPRSVGWVIEDLQNKAMASDSIFYKTPRATKVNQDRMDWFFEDGFEGERYNLPNHLRPKCQQGDHTYPAVYGRMRWEEPAPTLTTGFGCNGRGRFTHPLEARVLSPHEAARVQTFPDFFDMRMIKKRTDLHTLIGNAVPPLMARHVLSKLFQITQEGNLACE